MRPQIADAVIRELTFRSDHQVISLIAALSLSYLKEVTAPAAAVTRAVLIPAVARRQGPTAVFPRNEMAKGLFDLLGTTIELDREDEFHAFTAATAMMASYFQFAHATESWMEINGVKKDKANIYVGQMMFGLAAGWAASPQDFALLADEHQTRGGLNEQARTFLAEHGVFANISNALDEIKVRLVRANA